MTEKPLDWNLPALVLPPAEQERLPKGEPSPADLDRIFKAELKRRMRAAKRLKAQRDG